MTARNASRHTNSSLHGRQRAHASRYISTSAKPRTALISSIIASLRASGGIGIQLARLAQRQQLINTIAYRRLGKPHQPGIVQYRLPLEQPRYLHTAAGVVVIAHFLGAIPHQAEDFTLLRGIVLP